MVFTVYDILKLWNHSKFLNEVQVLLELEKEGFDIKESYQCLEILKDHGFLYCPFVDKIALT